MTEYFFVNVVIRMNWKSRFTAAGGEMWLEIAVVGEILHLVRKLANITMSFSIALFGMEGLLQRISKHQETEQNDEE